MLVGGTGLYFNSLINGLVDIPPIKQNIRNKLSQLLEKKGIERLYKILQKIDYEYSLQIHPNDKQRILRACEVFFSTKNKFSFYLKNENIKKNFYYIKIGINIDREQLYERINLRVDNMIKDGLIDEVKKVLSMGYDKNCPGLKGIGYKEIIQYLDGKISLDKAIYEIKKNSRHYAKRQLTWFKKIKDVKWFTNFDIKDINDYINQELKKINFNYE